MTRLGAPLVFLFSILPGCTDETETRPGLRVIGSSHKDFGRVKAGEVELAHVFEVQNVSDRRLRIANVRQNCSCLDLEIAARDVEPGATTRVAMRLDDKLVAGRKVAMAVLELDDVAVEPLYLKLSASVTRDCLVMIHPAQWTLPAAADNERSVEKVFRVRQVMTEGIDQIAETRVRSLDRQLSITRVGEWASIGKVINGRAREAEVALTYHRNGETIQGSKQFELEFELEFHSPVGGSSQFKTSATILVKQL